MSETPPPSPSRATAASLARRFEGLAAVVTGAGRGIGRAIAVRLSALGAGVVFVARSADELSAATAEAGETAVAFPCDIAAAAAPGLIVDFARSRFGRLDILVHSAGVIVQERMKEADLSAFDEMYSINLRAPYALTQAALTFLARTQGQVLFVNSTITRAANIVGRGGFAATQHALKAVADSLRDEVNEDGVRVISLMAGTTATARQERLHRVLQKPYRPERLLQTDDIAQAACDALAMPRTAEVTDVYIRPMLKS
jgi:NADP-dependent 3-hydroxy acid dehydrogenase YdfG